MQKKITDLLALIMGAVILFAGCKKDDPENPYDAIQEETVNQNPSADDLPEGSFAWLHAKVFRPTCANSGCHDGTFEPEFRTMSSAYNSLVNHPVIANDPGNTFEYRVVPGNANASFLHERLTEFVPNTSGVMPLSIEPTSDWNTLSDFYIQKITAWINDGAKDMYGNPAPSGEMDTPPVVYGMVIYPQGNTTTPYPREEGGQYPIGAVLVPAEPVDVWLFPFDNEVGVTGFESVGIKVSDNISDFSSASLVECIQSPPITALDFTNGLQSFYYKATLDFTGVPSGESRYLRSYIDDGAQTVVTELPNASSNYFWYLLFSVKVQ